MRDIPCGLIRYRRNTGVMVNKLSIDKRLDNTHIVDVN